jgi:integrase
MTLGNYPAMTLAGARKSWGEAQAALAEGNDPGSGLVRERRDEKDADTIKELANRYIAKYASKKKSGSEDERILKKDVVPAWGRHKAKDITRKDIIRLLDGIVDRGSPIQANRTLAVVRKMFKWAARRDDIPSNPCTEIDAPGGKENKRDRVLRDPEVKALWKGLDSAKTSNTIKLAIKFVLVTAQRRGEVAGIELSEIDEDESVWEIPATKAKNGVAHRVHLSDLAMSVLHEAKGLTEGPQRWLFPSPRSDNAITPDAMSHALYKNLNVIGVEGIRIHDLRRTGATRIAELGFTRLVIQKVLNHVDSSVTGRYDRFEYAQEKSSALDAWAARIESIVSDTPIPANVVELGTRQS